LVSVRLTGWPWTWFASALYCSGICLVKKGAIVCAEGVSDIGTSSSFCGISQVSSESCNIWLWPSKAVVCLLLGAIVAPAADGDAIARGFEVTSIGSTGLCGSCERDMPVKLFEEKAGTRMLCMAQWRDSLCPKSSYFVRVLLGRSHALPH